jgi:hypothetical protein
MRAFLLFLLLVVAGFFAASGFLLEKASYLLVDAAGRQIEQAGFGLTGFRFAGVRLQPSGKIVWKKLEASAQTLEENIITIKGNLSLTAEAALLQLPRFRDHALDFRIKNLQIIFEEIGRETSRAQRKNMEQKIVVPELEIKIPLIFSKPSETLSALKHFVRSLKDLLIEGRSPLWIRFNGILSLYFNERLMDVHFGILREGADSVMTIDREDLLRISTVMDENLTDAEVDLLAHNPARAPKLLQITEYASTTAREAHLRDPLLSEDAYRHVLWSYLLTREYGSQFAKELTDAHENGDNDETAIEHKKDLHNNEVGQHYALAEFALGSIRNRILSDPDVKK